MNSKIDRVAREIEKTRAKITEAQERLKELERQKTDMENTEVVNLFRSVDIAPGELAAILQAYKENGSATSVASAAPSPDYRQASGYSNTNFERQEDNIDE